MARPYACRSPCQNFLPAGKDKLAETAPEAPTNNNGTSSHTPVVSRVPTLTPAPPLASAKLVAKYINTNLQRAIKLALELFV